jgi:uncharacterized RmlC-like cupin family protein
MKVALFPALFLLGAALASIPTAPSAVLFDNNEAKVFRALEKAHVPGKFHQHEMNRVMVYLQSGQQRFEYQDGKKPEVFDWKAGEVKWSPPTGMHKPEVLDHDFNIIEVELKTPGTDKPITGKLDPVKVAPANYKVEFENPQVRVLRVKIGPHAAVPMHAHTTDRVTVFLTDQRFQVKDADGKVDTVEHKAGDVAWSMPTTHAEQNLSDQPFEAVAVEIKK